MRAVVYTEVGGPLRVQEVPEPECPPDAVVLDVRATGVCRSDWHAWRGHDPVALPHVPGHEFAGVVARVGADVTSWRPGDRVTAPFVCGCGTCGYCRAGDPQVCPDQTQPGFTHHGSFAERVVVRSAEFNLVRLPDRMSFVAAAGLGCRVATAYRALTAHGRLGAGEWLAVHGCGGVGLSAVLLGRALGARVVAVDVAADALALAADRGAEVVLDGSAADVPGQIHRITGGGAHVSVDALGSPDTAVASVRSLRRRGRHVQVGLLLGPDATPPLPMDRVVAWELSVHGSHGIAPHEYAALLDLVATAGIDPASLVGRVIPLEEAGAALAAMDGPTPAGMTVVALDA
ncbi:MAG TPA: zinc-dependent alcohol dehydrogenase family protein [Pseudonocardia sp.]|uniref:zinc-dependent alcohol dehydrogenase family protein n=1 Tax=Pseudonocardia sp. TaxID=60912 RepID=UPI002B4B013E|nr:zinc-dependent alcohol dehydrogenase family protein [Pseudonocardia sp.]HLU53863.1 zinc-dependent alcohol dehydrogenase family protein [Pseudonocardia sp.]